MSVADDLVIGRPVTRHLAPGGVEGQRDVVVLEHADQDRRPDQSREPPPSSQKDPVAAGETCARDVLGSTGSHQPTPRKLATSSAPCRDRIDSGWNCTPSSGRVTVAHRHHDAVGASPSPRARTGTDRRPRASGSALPRTATGSRRARRLRCACTRRHLAVGRLDPVHRRRRTTSTRACMPRQTPSTGTPSAKTAPPRAKSAGLPDVPGPGESTMCVTARARPMTPRVVVLDDLGQSSPVTAATRCTRFQV